jgi:predicted transglutaminase-like cysteine proteinase
MQLSSRALALLASIVATATLNPTKANAAPLLPSSCAEFAMGVAPPKMMVEPAQSRLDIMRMQQESGFAPITVVNDLPSLVTDNAPVPCGLGEATQAQAAVNDLEPQTGQFSPVPNRPDIFGSIALPIARTPLDSKWQSASKSRLAKRSGPWKPLLKSVSGKSRAEQIQAINIWVNARVQFSDDRTARKSADVWSAASETLHSGRGDCEDYAIAKMKLLEAIGVERADIYLVIVDDLVRRADHALLVVRLGKQMLVLDNGTDQMLDADQITDYRPIFSYGVVGTWIHGYPQSPVRIASR